MIQPEGSACSDLRHPPILGDLFRYIFFRPVVLFVTKLLHQRAGVDSNRTSQSTTAVARARLDRVIFVLPQKCFCNDRATRLPQHFPAQHDSLARRGGNMPARANGFAVAALYATVDFILNGWDGVQVPEGRFRVSSKH